MANGATNGIADAIIKDIFDNNRRFLPGSDCTVADVREHFAGQILVDALEHEERLLLLSILPQGPTDIRLEEAEKGLGRSRNFQARYQASGGLSKRFVVKVGEIRKIEREAIAVQRYAAPMIIGTNNPVWRRGPNKAIIAQEFVGLRKNSQLTSLRNAVRDNTAGREYVANLLRDTLSPWFEEAIENGPSPVVVDTLLSRHIKKGGTPELPTDWAILNDWVKRISGMAWQPPDERLADLLRRTVQVPLSISHGDLHSQNVLVDPTGRCWPIDFAWCMNESSLVVDLVMLECSLKFLAFPMRADLREMIRLETNLCREYVPAGAVKAMPYSTEVENVLGAIVEVRKFGQEAGISFQDYLTCLCMMTSSLATHLHLNRPLVLASLQILMGTL